MCAGDLDYVATKIPREDVLVIPAPVIPVTVIVVNADL